MDLFLMSLFLTLNRYLPTVLNHLFPVSIKVLFNCFSNFLCCLKKLVKTLLKTFRKTSKKFNEKLLFTIMLTQKEPQLINWLATLKKYFKWYLFKVKVVVLLPFLVTLKRNSSSKTVYEWNEKNYLISISLLKIQHHNILTKINYR